jgi:rubrerythrin
MTKRSGKTTQPKTVSAKTKPAANETYTAFMSRAYAMELEATDRYTQFADELETLGNHDVSMLFRKLAEIEAQHARQILAEMGWTSLPALTPAFAWQGSEGPETAPRDSLQHPIQPWQALEIALRCEIQAQKYFENIASGAERVLAAAGEMAAEEREHVRLIRDWLSRVKPPAFGAD